MTQGFALRCVATGSAYRMIWTATQHRNRKKFLSLRCVAIQIILYALPVTTQHSATLASYYKPALSFKNVFEIKFFYVVFTGACL